MHLSQRSLAEYIVWNGQRKFFSFCAENCSFCSKLDHTEMQHRAHLFNLTITFTMWAHIPLPLALEYQSRLEDSCQALHRVCKPHTYTPQKHWNKATHAGYCYILLCKYKPILSHRDSNSYCKLILDNHWHMCQHFSPWLLLLYIVHWNSNTTTFTHFNTQYDNSFRLQINID